MALARDVPKFRLKRLLRFGLDLAPPNFLIDLALSTSSMRKIAEQVYFHARGTAGVDRETYIRWLDGQNPARGGVGSASDGLGHA